LLIRMAKLSRSKNGEWISRRGIPRDVRDAYTRLYRGISKAPLRVTRAGKPPTAPKVWEELFKAPAGTSLSAAKVQWAEWTAEIETRVSGLRAAAKGEGRSLTHLNAAALAGRWWSWFLKQYENDPRLPSYWAELQDYFVWDVIGREAPDEHKADADPDPTWEWSKAPEVRDAVRPVVAELASVALFLANAGIALDPAAYKLFTNSVSDLLFGVFGLLEKRARGDHTPDETPKSFPAFVESKVTAAAELSCWDLFEAWVNAAKRAGSSVRRSRGVFLAMQANFVNLGAGQITGPQAKAWIESLITPQRIAFTVSNVWLSASKAVFNWGVGQGKIASNPFTGIKVTQDKRTRNRASKSFTTKEAKTILDASQQITTLKTPMDRTKRWVPVLCAYTGARAGEMTQLRREDVRLTDGIYYAHLSPDAGTIKSGQARTVPLHEHLIELGFIDFIEASPRGPLFYKAAKSSKTSDHLNPKRGPAVKARERLGEWVRAIGVVDPELSPSHAWRHTFLSKARQAGIERALRFAITGHELGTEGDKYGQPEPEELAEALKKFPRYDFVARTVGKVGN
jgi:integrase